jgi:hypothetical protein
LLSQQLPAGALSHPLNYSSMHPANWLKLLFTPYVHKHSTESIRVHLCTQLLSSLKGIQQSSPTQKEIDLHEVRTDRSDYCHKQLL